MKSWDEETYKEFGENAKLTRASVTQNFSGDIEGDGSFEYLMMYENETPARFVGQQQIVGRIGKRSGSFVLQLRGTFDGSKVEANWSVVPGSATEELRGILRGKGNLSAPLGSTASATLD
ncbi:MAG: DUF3224 domain-containing protein [Balneolales bacterium]